jgi:hypothetical protein
MVRYAAGAFLFITLASCASWAQNPPASDPQALAYAAQSIAAIVGNVSISDVTLTGNVAWTAGSDSETGTATLLASGTGESRMNLVLPSGTRTEIRDASTGASLGQWINQNGTSGPFAPQNCWTDAVWFFPVLGSLAAGSNVVLSYIGPETWNGQSVQHIQSYVYEQYPYSGPSPSPQQLTTMDFYLNATTLVPVAVTFNAHPDTNAGTNISLEVDFSNYQVISGVLVPTHIQRYRQNTLEIDLTVTSASFNTGISLSNFSIN